MGKEKKDTPPKADYVILDNPADHLINDTTAREKFRVFQISKKISRYLFGLLFATGAVSIFLSVEYLLGTKLLLALELKTLFVFALGFIGLVNLTCGLLLLAKE